MIDETYRSELASALRERLAAIGDHAARERDAAAHLEQLRGASEKIERLHARLPAGASAQLAHFLERRSYDKALELLEASPE